MKSVAVIVIAVVLFAVAGFAQQSEPQAIVAAAVSHTLSNHFPYVEHVVLHNSTSALPVADNSSWPEGVSTKYIAASKSLLPLSGIAVLHRVKVADLSVFETGKSFAWDRFVAQHGDAWVLRVSAPVKISADEAVLRLDLARPSHRAAQGELTVDRVEGRWKVIGGTVR